MSSVVKEDPLEGGKQLHPTTSEHASEHATVAASTASAIANDTARPNVRPSTNNNKGGVVVVGLPTVPVSSSSMIDGGQSHGLGLPSGPNVTLIPPVLQISHPPDQEDCDSSSSEYESFPDTASDHDDLSGENTPLDLPTITFDNTITFDKTSSTKELPVGVSSSNGRSNISPTPKCDGDTDPDRNEDSADDTKQWLPPQSELQDKVIKQVEFYFSDANITKDAFLLKHVRRNKHGFVSIKLISSFKKIRKLTKDWKVVSFSLQSSANLELNPEGTKVKRNKPLPEIDLSAPLRTVVVVNFHEDDPSVESVKDMFDHCGNVTLVRIVRPNKTFPPDVQRHIESHIEIRDKVVGLVEFDKTEAAQKAVKMMNGEDDWRSGLSVMLLAKVPSKKKGKEKQREIQSRPDQSHLSGGDADTAKSKTRKKRKNKNKNRVDELTHDEGRSVTPSSSECENSPSPNRRYTNKAIPIPNTQHLSPSGTPRSSPCQSPHGSPRGQRKIIGRSPHVGSPHSGSPHGRGAFRGSASPHGSPELRRKAYEKSDKEGNSDSSNSPSPWFQRRRMLAAQAKDASPGSSPMLTRRMINPSSGVKPQMSGRDCLLRTPRGPENCKGFYEGKGRGQPFSV